MEEELHIPWTRGPLAELARQLVSVGETTKVDLKASFDVSGSKQQSELLKDISALANTYSHHYKNHGFIIFGASSNKITYTVFPDTEDHLQASIDDLVKKYIGPLVDTHLFIFDDGGQKWGVLVVPPTRKAPHVFINDICKRYRGDVYVRSGTITEKALPGDYARFFRQHLDEYNFELSQTIGDIKVQLSEVKAKLEEKSNKEKEVNFAIPANHAVIPSVGKPAAKEAKRKAAEAVPKTSDSKTVTENINELFEREEDAIVKGLFNEARKIINFLGSSSIPWLISHSSKEQSTQILSEIESVSKEFWLAITNLVLKDDKGIYDEALLRAMTYLARQINPPASITFTSLGEYIRYYPLFVSLYLISIVGVAKKRSNLLKKIFKMNLEGRSQYDEPLSVTYVLFFMRRAADVFHPIHDGYPQQKWCDPVASYTKLLIDRLWSFEDPFWDQEREFYRGEYVLCIAPMDITDRETKALMIDHPSSGLYLFISSAVPAITRFLRDENNWIKGIFERPLKDLLNNFDQTADKLGRGSSCFPSGFTGGAVSAAFPGESKTLS